MGSITFNQVAGAAIGSLLVFMLLGFASGLIYHGAGGHDGEQTLAYALDTGEEDDATAEEEAAEPVSLAALVADADVEAGAQVFNQCKACHKIEDGANAVGPHLWNVLGREIAGLGSFSYSDALKAKEGVWDLETMSAWLENPSEWAPGTIMGYAGLSDPADRVNVIAYMNAESGDAVDLAAMAPEAQADAGSGDEAAAEDAAAEDTDGGDAMAAAGETAGGGGDRYADLLANASAENGETVFNQCKACHKIEDGANGVGPHLYNVVGREIAAVEDYSYSDALAGKDGVWDLDNLMVWLEDPNKFAAGNKMMMGYPDPQDRIDVITYLNQAGSDSVDLGFAGTAAETDTAEAAPEDAAGAEDAAEAETQDTAGAGADAGEGTEVAAAGGGQYADLLAEADADAGAKVFNQCRACHKVEDGANGVGPHLHGVVGREIASVEDYSYSDALAGKDGVWDLETLMKWLEAPNKFASGNKMMMGYPDPQDRINVITYLNEVDGSPEALQ